MSLWTGLDILVDSSFQELHGRRVGLVCNQASISSTYRNVLDLFLEQHKSGAFELKSVFGPQHGLFGHTQDNMIEWEADGKPRFPVNIHSLYGQHRQPTPAMLEAIDVLVVDLQEVGSRYYTFIWTLALCLKACEPLGITVMVLDRPNPIGGTKVEGPMLDPSFTSFVGLYPLPIRHGMTLGEIANHLKRTYFSDVDLQVVRMQGWDRIDYLDRVSAPWGMPSPNMPTVDTAVVYPGGCFIEGTNLSEGRGTTRPFEIVGAPFIDGWKLADALNSRGLSGVHFRPLQFEPTFNKHARKLCEGVFVHVTDRESFAPVMAYVALMQDVRALAGDHFQWNPPPYEYEYVKLPIDILAGNTWLREAIDDQTPLDDIRERAISECADFEPIRQESLLYGAA